MLGQTDAGQRLQSVQQDEARDQSAPVERGAQQFPVRRRSDENGVEIQARSDRTGNLILVAARGRLSEDPGRTQSQLWLSRRTSPLKS